MPIAIPADKHLVFVSHSSQDMWVARQIAREIENCGAKAFLARPWALDRPYVWAELGAAWGRRIPIVALLTYLGQLNTRVRQRAGEHDE